MKLDKVRIAHSYVYQPPTWPDNVEESRLFIIDIRQEFVAGKNRKVVYARYQHDDGTLTGNEFAIDVKLLLREVID